MLTPIAIATWIAFCIPWAEPRLAEALVEAGSGGEPLLISDGNEIRQLLSSYPDAVKNLRTRLAESGFDRRSPNHTLYVGLMQVPIFALDELGIDPEIALDKCANLEIGYSLFLTAYDQAGKSQKSPWKRTAAAFSWFRNRQPLVDSPYAKRATDFLMTPSQFKPAGINEPLYHAIAAEWSEGIANRAAMRTTSSFDSSLTLSSGIAEWARKNY